jgi:hypothetical protein
MPARPVVADVVQLLFRGTFGGTHNWVNKQFVSYSGAAPSAADLTTYAANVYDVMVSQLIPMQSTATTTDEVEATDLASAMGAVGSGTGVNAGSRAGGEIPGSACALVSYHVSRHYRGGHPRTYIAAGVTTDLLTPATWTTAFIAALDTAWGLIWTQALTGAGAFVPVDHVNVSYFSGGVARLVPVVDVIVPAAGAVQAELASQRRRIGRK